ncbi:hypothetical protein [Sphingomonas sp. PAMC 26621]|uniref:hypothetical protein n=1 Tax=Sphingomonas sp. PAMC 26621 TaxID=1112213 RepID=UPI000289AFBA
MLIFLAPFPPAVTEPDRNEGVGATGDFAALLRMPRFLAGVVTQFFYVGAQVGVWSFMIRYTEVALPGTRATEAAGYLTVSLVVFMVGRFVGAGLMGRIRPLPLLSAFAAAACACCLFAASVGGMAGVVALVASSFFMSIMYPTIFAETVDGLGVRTKAGSALLVMAIIGGAVFTAGMGLVSDATGSILRAMIVPAACFLVVLLFGLLSARKPS